MIKHQHLPCGLAIGLFTEIVKIADMPDEHRTHHARFIDDQYAWQLTRVIHS